MSPILMFFPWDFFYSLFGSLLNSFSQTLTHSHSLLFFITFAFSQTLSRNIHCLSLTHFLFTFLSFSLYLSLSLSLFSHSFLSGFFSLSHTQYTHELQLLHFPTVPPSPFNSHSLSYFVSLSFSFPLSLNI